MHDFNTILSVLIVIFCVISLATCINALRWLKEAENAVKAMNAELQKLIQERELREEK